MNDKKAQTRERILSAASAALTRRGPAEPSVGDVMGAAGLTVGGFYAHFESKDALMLEAFSQTLRRRRALMGELDRSLPASERRALAAAFSLSRKHRDAFAEDFVIRGLAAAEIVVVHRGEVIVNE